MMDTKLISVIVPVYNVEKYLNKCLKSICEQSYKNLEIILVDDGSTDFSANLCDEWGQKDYRIKVIHKKNGGLSSARNVGIENSTGNYLFFVDSDDWLKEDCLEYLINLMEDNQAEIAICDVLHCYENVDEYHFLGETKVCIFDSKEAVREMLYQKSFLVTVGGKLYNKNCFKYNRFPDGKLFEDSAIMHHVFFCANRIVYSNAQKYGYNHRENSITTKKFSKRDLDILEIVNEIIEFCKYDKELYKAAISYYISANLRVYLNAPDDNMFRNTINDCKKNIKKYYFKVITDIHIRSKLRFALILFLFGKKVLKFVYKFKNRWE